MEDYAKCSTARVQQVLTLHVDGVGRLRLHGLHERVGVVGGTSPRLQVARRNVLREERPGVPGHRLVRASWAQRHA